MRALVASVIALAGCYDDQPGVLIEAQSPVPATRFELLFSTEHCEECTQIYPPSFTNQRAADPFLGEGWKTTDLERFAIELPAASNTARFQIAADEDGRVKRAILVALAGDQMQEFETVLAVATLGPFDVDAGASVKFEVPMLAADALGSATDNEHVELWRRKLDMDTHTACVVVQHHDGYPAAEFFVPADDTDCDNPVPVECNAFGYKADGAPATLDKANCVHKDELHNCRIGGPPCAEAGTTIQICAPVAPSYCLPSYICELGCTADLGCNTAGYPAAPLATCNLFTEQGRPCEGTNLPSSGKLDLGELVVDYNGACKSIEIAKPRIGESIVFGDTMQVGGATFLLDVPTFDPLSCSVTIKWMGTFVDSSFAAVKVVTPDDINRVVPLRLNAASQCPTAPPTVACSSFAGDRADTLFTCE